MKSFAQAFSSQISAVLSLKSLWRHGNQDWYQRLWPNRTHGLPGHLRSEPLGNQAGCGRCRGYVHRCGVFCVSDEALCFAKNVRHTHKTNKHSPNDTNILKAQSFMAKHEGIFLDSVLGVGFLRLRLRGFCCKDFVWKILKWSSSCFFSNFLFIFLHKKSWNFKA